MYECGNYTVITYSRKGVNMTEKSPGPSENQTLLKYGCLYLKVLFFNNFKDTSTSIINLIHPFKRFISELDNLRQKILQMDKVESYFMNTEELLAGLLNNGAISFSS